MNGDDDDVFTTSAMDIIREHCTEDKLYVFKMLQSSIVIPITDEIKIGNIGTPCGVYPAIKNLPPWGEFNGGDGQFYIDLSKLLPVQFVNKVIYHIKQDGDGDLPEKPTMYCKCGVQANLTFDRMLYAWIGYCSRCQIEFR